MTEQEYKKYIYEKAGEVKDTKDLKKLLKEIEQYQHDYGTIVYACFAGAIAGFNLVNQGSSGGITGFQASCLGWEAVEKFMSIKAPAKILDYREMLYPQMEHKFEKTISKDTWKALQEKANELLTGITENVSPKVADHWRAVASGEIPFGYSINNDL